MKAKIVYACGEWALLSSDEGRSYFTRVIKVGCGSAEEP